VPLGGARQRGALLDSHTRRSHRQCLIGSSGGYGSECGRAADTTGEIPAGLPGNASPATGLLNHPKRLCLPTCVSPIGMSPRKRESAATGLPSPASQSQPILSQFSASHRQLPTRPGPGFPPMLVDCWCPAKVGAHRHGHCHHQSCYGRTSAHL